MKMNFKIKIIVIIVASLTIFLGCGTKDSQNPAEYSDCLIVPEGAEQIHYYKMKGTDQVIFQLNERFPANSIIQHIDMKLKDMGWSRLEYDFMNPDIPSSFIRGWTSFIDGTKKPERDVWAWSSNWENKNGDIVGYSLRYDYPRNTQRNMTQMQAITIYYPSALAKQIIADTDRIRKQMKD